jgi:hypothetical protein
MPSYGLLTNPSNDIIDEISKIYELNFEYVEIGIEWPEGNPRYHTYRISLLSRSSRKERKNQWNSTGKDNFILHNSYKNWATIHWNRFIWIQNNSCFAVLYRKSKTYEKKIYQTITYS